MGAYLGAVKRERLNQGRDLHMAVFLRKMKSQLILLQDDVARPLPYHTHHVAVVSKYAQTDNAVLLSQNAGTVF
jgi:hypothetical protein